MANGRPVTEVTKATKVTKVTEVTEVTDRWGDTTTYRAAEGSEVAT